ncbi:FeoA family protein [Pedobacter sp. P26]|uniref:FeoA family protein n=1 Tax=Pedobacter sp. P26 TaxID=3423956 RepID=UPI003D67B149
MKSRRFWYHNRRESAQFCFLKHLEKLGLTLGKQIQITDVTDFDGSVEIRLSDKQVNISREVAKHILISSNGKN